MKFLTLLLFALASASAEAKSHCAPSPKVAPKLRYDFSISINFGPTIELGTGIYSADQSYISSAGGTFCATWNGGISGTILPGGTALYYHTLNSTGPYKLELQYLLKTDDEPPAYILVKQKGWEVNYVGRTHYVLETGDSRYFSLNAGVWTGVETGYFANATGTFSSGDAYLVV